MLDLATWREGASRAYQVLCERRQHLLCCLGMMVAMQLAHLCWCLQGLESMTGRGVVGHDPWVRLTLVRDLSRNGLFHWGLDLSSRADDGVPLSVLVAGLYASSGIVLSTALSGIEMLLFVALGLSAVWAFDQRSYYALCTRPPFDQAPDYSYPIALGLSLYELEW